MCGMFFEKTDTVCTTSCALRKNCASVRCPGCDYEFPDEDRSLSFLRRLFRRRRVERAPGDGSRTSLEQLRSGESAELLELDCASSNRRNTLTVFGLTPGTEITLLQRSPSFVIRVGETELGLDREIARGIFVRRR
jgi:Fe2+ transport system protein FeoA